MLLSSWNDCSIYQCPSSNVAVRVRDIRLSVDNISQHVQVAGDGHVDYVLFVTQFYQTYGPDNHCLLNH